MEWILVVVIILQNAEITTSLDVKSFIVAPYYDAGSCQDAGEDLKRRFRLPEDQFTILRTKAFIRYACLGKLVV